MSADPPEAKPSDVAVALRYDAPGAPVVVAKGRGEIARRIVETAREHDVPLQENAELAVALATVELDTAIPRELYQAVAVVIGFILRTSKVGAAPRR